MLILEWSALIKESAIEAQENAFVSKTMTERLVSEPCARTIAPDVEFA
jgi:hypothetical protein